MTHESRPPELLIRLGRLLLQNGPRLVAAWAALPESDRAAVARLIESAESPPAAE